MTDDAKLVVHLLSNNRGLKKGFQTAKTDMKQFVGAALKIAAPLAAAFGAGELLRVSRDDILQQRKLAAVLKATGHAAGFTAEQIKQFANQRQRLTNFANEATTSAAAVLATFKEIKGDVFREAIIAAQDMSSVMETDLKSSIVQVGKALNDPIRGVSALSEVGVSFTDQQRKQIKALAEANQLMKAQKIILGELKGEFGGAAEAMRDDLTQLENAWNDIKVRVGKLTVIPAAKALKDIEQSGFETGRAMAQREPIEPITQLLRAQQRGANLRGEILEAQRLRMARDRAARDTPALARFAAASDVNTRQPFVAMLRKGLGGIGLEGPSLRRTTEETAKINAQRVSGFFKGLTTGFENFALNTQIAFDTAVSRQEDWVKSQEEIASVYERTRTPLERFTKDASRLQELFEAGRIDDDLLHRGRLEAAEAAGLTVKDRGPVGGVAAVDIRSADAFSAIQAAIRQGQSGGSKNPAEKTARFTEQAVKVLRQIERKVGDNQLGEFPL